MNLYLIIALIIINLILIFITAYQISIIREIKYSIKNNNNMLKQSSKLLDEKLELQNININVLNKKNNHLEKRLNNQESIMFMPKVAAASDVIDLYQKGYSIKTISDKLHRGRQEIDLILKRFQDESNRIK